LLATPWDLPFGLKDKVILVTGGAKRIGREIALGLAREGARVAVHYGTSHREAEATATECSTLSGHHTPILQADLARVAEIERMFTELDAQCGRIDGLVNNAARFLRHNVLDVTEAEWDSLHSVNLKAYFFCAQQAARRILAQQTPGRIVNLSSLGALQPWREHVPYNASKAGVVMLTKALAKALAPSITVNSVAPGLIPLDDRDHTQTNEGLISATPAARHGSPADITSAVLFFLKASNYTTGQILAVDGGLSLR
jgi:NAD(P)-dependent dehydrogenase (short-subunit alcohol dehydrogenase family)